MDIWCIYINSKDKPQRKAPKQTERQRTPREQTKPTLKASKQKGAQRQTRSPYQVYTPYIYIDYPICVISNTYTIHINSYIQPLIYTILI